MILVPTDGAAHSARAIDEAIDYARLAHSRLIGLAVIEPEPTGWGVDGTLAGISLPPEQSAESIAKANIAAFVARVTAAELPYETAILTGENVWSVILETADLRRCDAIFMGSNGRGPLDALLMGSETISVLRHSKLPVMVLR
jgi:nucleotide-binding universal stress UspA family protein